MAGQPTPSAETSAQAIPAFAEQRRIFRGLLLQNPNHFGNLTESAFTPALSLIRNTHYEELACVGYQPQQKRLEAVVHIYEPNGYGSGVCGDGTPEYVRFYLSYDNGGTWSDAGLTSFRAYDIPQGTAGRRQLEYAVSLAVDPDRKICSADPLIRVRAILSWNNEPPAGQPHWTPVWGNVREVSVQVEPRRRFSLSDLFDIGKIKIPLAILPLIDVNALIAPPIGELNLADKMAQYKGKEVPGHRVAHKEIHAFLMSGAALNPNFGLTPFPVDPDLLKIDPGIFGKYFGDGDGDIGFEELTCIGLDPNMPDTMVGIVKIKKQAGYSGGPCTQGSKEYVSFWADFDGNGSFETHLGTASVKTYDLPHVPADGAHYAVRLPVDLSEHRRKCKNGAVVVRIRAILSWEVEPPAIDPNYKPVWGNREEALIHIAPIGVTLGKIAILGGIPVSKISAAGLTTPSAFFATNNLAPDSLGRPCPFAGRVTVQGLPLPGTLYKVEVTNTSSGIVPVVSDLLLTRQDGTTYIHKADPSGRFLYVSVADNVENVLAQWDTAGDATWEVRLTVYDAASNPVGMDSHNITLDNTAPTAFVEITSGAGNCGKFHTGTMVSGNLIATDDYLSGYTLTVEPGNLPGVGIPVPSSGSVNTPVSGIGWNLNSVGMQPCGYVVRLSVSDRAIINSQSVGHAVSFVVGLCLDKE